MCSIPRPAYSVDALAAACDTLSARDLDALDEARLRADVETLTRIAAQVTAERLRCVAAVAGRAPDRAAGAEQAQRLLQTAGRLSGGQAARQAKLASSLTDPRLQATAAALAAGRISPAQAEALAQAARTHPQLIATAQDELVDQASRTDDRAFRETLADRRHAADPGPEEQRACRQYAARRMSLSTLADGMGRVEGLLDPVGFAYLRTAVDALAGPDASTASRPISPAPAGGPDPATVPDEQRRTPEQRNADALVELARKALARTDELPSAAGLQPKATVFISPETLAEELGAPAARLDWAGVICGATARRVACDAEVVRRQVTKDGRTVWVDVRRYPSPAQRLAVIERDRACRFVYPDRVRCERPWQWCDVHHVEHHGDGGPTTIPNLVLLCGQHHHAVHEGGWWVTGTAEATLIFHPPLGWPHHPPRPRLNVHRHTRDPDPLQLVLIE